MRSFRGLRVLPIFALSAVLIGAGAAPAAAADGPDSDPDAPAVVALDAAGTDVDDFEFASFDAVYELSRGDDGRSQLRTVETLVAVFPDVDQNRGIKRALVTDYKGHSTNIEVVRVTDENGMPRHFEALTDLHGFMIVTIAVPAGSYVHDEQTYVLEYTQSDVTATSTDLTDGVTRDEFFWDTNGTGWAQPFGEVSATVRVDPEIVPALTGEAYCYYGDEGSTDQCPIDHRDDGEFTASVSDLSAAQNMTIVVSFDEGTFAGPPWWTSLPVLGLLAIALALLGLIIALVARFVFGRDAPGRGTIIPQYEGPKGLGMFAAANIAGKPEKAMAATIVHLAVQRNLRILEYDQGWGKVFGVQHLSSAGLTPEEQHVMGALFPVDPLSMGGILPGGSAPTPLLGPVGQVRWFTKGDAVLGQQVVALTKAVKKEIQAGGLRRKLSPLPMIVALSAVALAMILIPIEQIFGREGDASAIVVAIGFWLPFLPLIIAIRGLYRRPLTTKGAELREHLDGLREFIRVAEADRLQMLQSVSGAERVAVSDGAAIVKIYEKLLPFAVIFGLEKEWAAEIAKYYSTTSPDWYVGTNYFDSSGFVAGIGSLTSNVSTSYSGSSSSGGGGGGGGSGGGGGGGGGGGV